MWRETLRQRELKGAYDEGHGANFLKISVVLDPLR
jgi:hypothetical protein